MDDHAVLSRSLIEAQIDTAYTEVRRLQTEEAEHFRRAFEANLELPLGEGPHVLQEARTLINALEQIFEADGDDQAPAEAREPAKAEAPTVAATPVEAVPARAKA